jgi:hypothetical protein
VGQTNKTAAKREFLSGIAIGKISAYVISPGCNHVRPILKISSQQTDATSMTMVDVLFHLQEEILTLVLVQGVQLRLICRR